MIISRTPTRISLFGGGTDFPQWYKEHGGAVLSTAIDKYVYVVVKSRFDDKIVLHYTKTEVCDKNTEVLHDYIREALIMCGIEKGIEITTMADIPMEGTGLGGSSSLAVGLIHALWEYLKSSHYQMDLTYLAETACYLEIDRLKKGIGIQDQYIAAYGGFRFMTFDERGVTVTNSHEEKLVNRFTKQRESIEVLEKRLMLFYTGITRSATDILKDQTCRMSHNTEALMELQFMALTAQRYLELGEYSKIGNMLDYTWHMKKGLASNISNDEIDIMYMTALKAGAVGGKICGAGGGGFLLLYVEPENQESVRQKLRDYKELPFKFEPEGSKVWEI